MWDLLVAENAGSSGNSTSSVIPISTDEDAQSRVTPAEAVVFYSAKVVVAVSAPVVAAAEPEDDLFDDMAWACFYTDGIYDFLSCYYNSSYLIIDWLKGPLIEWLIDTIALVSAGLPTVESVLRFSNNDNSD